jgi:erythromycin esterase-like protein
MADGRAEPSGGRGAGVLREILDRFRRSAAVPAVMSDEIELELVPLFRKLDALELDAAALREASAQRIQADRDRTRADVERMLATGRAACERERTRVRAEGREAAEREAAELVRQAEVEVERIRVASDEMIPGLVSQVVACVLGAGR